MRRLVVARASALVFLSAACASGLARTSEVESYRTRAGDLLRAEVTAPEPRGRYVASRVRLVSSTGVTATGRLLQPPSTTGCFPAVLLQDGREEDSNVIGRLPAEFGDVVVLSLDYPADVPRTLNLRHALVDAERVLAAARDIPAVFSLGGAYLAARADVDTTRIALAATSFAVPFASIAAAADTRFREVALIYGAGDMPRVVAANLTLRPSFLRAPLAWIATQPFAELAPERFIGRIAPRPITMVNGVDDPQMPVDAVRRLYDAAREPKSLTWLRTGHLMPTDSALIRTLVDTAFAKLSVLHAPPDSLRCRRAAPRD